MGRLLIALCLVASLPSAATGGTITATEWSRCGWPASMPLS